MADRASKKLISGKYPENYREGNVPLDADDPHATPERAAYVIEQATHDWHWMAKGETRGSRFAEYLAARLRAEGLLCSEHGGGVSQASRSGGLPESPKTAGLTTRPSEPPNTYWWTP